MTAVLLAPWWRNHTLLVDFYDYGLVMAAALRMTEGEQPYVDFLTPIQTLHFRLAVWAEAVFGARYLSLTYANALFIGSAFLGSVVVLWRSLGFVTSVLVASAVVVASAGQHTIVWHNALGVMWMAAVVWLTAQHRPATGAGKWPVLCAVCLLLWLGGMTKLTYQASALAFAGLFALRDNWQSGHSWRQTALTLLSYFLFGVVAPLMTELVSTGATFDQWWQNVVVTPGGRLELLGQMASLRFYLHTPHDYYQPMHFSFVGAWGIGILALLAIPALRKALVLSSRLPLAAMAAGVWICGGVLLATNFDIAYMAGAAWLALVTGFALALPGDEGGRVNRRTRVILGTAAASLLLPAWLAAWNGTRAVWGHYYEGPSNLVSTDDLSERHDYFDGMRVTQAAHDSLKAFEQRHGQQGTAGRPTEGYYFINGTEWLMRIYPSVRLRGMPLWLHEGTTYGEDGAREIQQRLASSPEIEAVVSYAGWDSWKHGMKWYLEARYGYELVGPVFRTYFLRNDAREVWTDPLAFSTLTGSSADSRNLTGSGGPFVFRPADEGSYIGTPRSGRITIEAPLDQISGELVVRRTPVSGDATIRMIWRAVAIAGDDREETVLREEHIDIAGDQPEVILPFALTLPGHRVALDVFLPPDERLEAGFRRLHTDYAGGPATAALPAWLDPTLEVFPDTAAWGEALFTDERLRAAPIRGAGLAINPLSSEAGSGLFAHTPSEIWFKLEPGVHQLRGEYGMGSASWMEEHALPGAVAFVVFHRPGYMQVLHRQVLRPRLAGADREPQSFEVPVPDGGGWVGLIYKNLVRDQNAHGHSWWRKVEGR